MFSVLDIPKPKLIDHQKKLFKVEKDLVSTGTARWATGEFFENKTQEVSEAVRLRTDSRKEICPDLRYSIDIYFESKASGKSGSVILYECRVEKDRQFIQESGADIVYWIWCHRFPVLHAKTVDELETGLCQNLHSLLLLDSETLYDLVQGRKTRVVNSGAVESGSKKWHYNKYGIGWTIRTNEMKERCQLVSDCLRIKTENCYSKNARLYVSQSELTSYVFPKKLQRNLFK